jgi:O-antigen/teichoic acid export membrane protein
MSGREIFAVSRLLSVMALALPFCVTEEYIGRLAMISNERKAAFWPPLLGGIAVVILSYVLCPLGMTGGAMAFLLCHVLSVVLQGYLLRREMTASSLRTLPYLLWGLAVLCLVYRWANRMLAPYDTANPVLLPLAAIILGGILYLTVCRFTLGRERSNPLP